MATLTSLILYAALMLSGPAPLPKQANPTQGTHLDHGVIN